LGYSEHYKDKSQGFSSLQSRDCRKARELSLELWSPAQKSDFFESFLKAQRNLQKIGIRIIKANCSEGLLKQFLKALCKINWLNRLHIDFEKGQNQQASYLFRNTRCLKTLPKLKDWAITIDGKEVYPFSASLLKIGFESLGGSISVKNSIAMQKLMKRTPKFDQLDTIKVDNKRLVCFPEEFLDGLVFVISKLPNFRELDFNYSRDLYLPMKQTFKVLDALVKAPKLEIFRMGIQMKGLTQVSMLQHPLFKAKSLEKIHLSLFLYREITPVILNKILDLLQAMPSLYELYLDLSNYVNTNDGLMDKVIEMTSLRKLKIVFNYHAANLSANQAGNIVRWIFNKMVLLEELDLQLPKNGLELNEEDTQGLPRLRKVSIVLKQCEPHMEKSVWRVIGILGKSLRLRELELDVTDSVYDFSEASRRLFDTLGKLKGLQVLNLRMNATLRKEKVSISLLKEFTVVFGNNTELI